MDRAIKFNWAPSLKEAKQGDQVAQEFIYRKIYLMVKKVARSHTFSSADAEDLTQEIMINIFSHLDQVQHPEAFLSWARTVAERCALSEARKQAKRKNIASVESMPEVSDEDEQGMDQIEDLNAANPEVELDHSMVRETLNQIYQTLPEIQATCLTMWRDGYTGAEIAETLQIPLGTVKSHLHQAKRRVKGAVLNLQKQGVYLYSLAPITFFSFLLSLDEKFDQAAVRSMSSAVIRSHLDGTPVQPKSDNPVSGQKRNHPSMRASNTRGSHMAHTPSGTIPPADHAANTISGAGAKAATAAGSAHTVKIAAIVTAVCIGGAAAVPVIRNIHNSGLQVNETVTASSGLTADLSKRSDTADLSQAVWNSSNKTENYSSNPENVEKYTSYYKGTLDNIANMISNYSQFDNAYELAELGIPEIISYYGATAGAHIGYTVTDLSGNGVPELVIGTIGESDVPEWNNLIACMFTYKNGEVVNVFRSLDWDAYYYLGNGKFLNTSNESGYDGKNHFSTYSFDSDGTKLICNDSYFYEPIANSNQFQYYHNATGDLDPSSSEKITITDDVFRQKENDLKNDVQQLSLTPFSNYKSD